MLRRVLSGVAILLGSLTVALVMGEVTIRIVQWRVGLSEEYRWAAASRWRAIHRLADNRDLLYDLLPHSTATIDYGPRGKVTYRISSQGVRGPERVVPKPEGTRRVLILGDSVTFGYYVPEDSTFASRAEEILRRDDPSIEVINGGVGGYNTHNQMAWLIDHGLAFEPDAVVLAFCPNDVDNPHFHFSWHTLDKLGPLPEALFPDPAMAEEEPPQPGGPWFSMTRHSRLVSFVDARLAVLRMGLAVSAAHRGPEAELRALRSVPFGDCLLSLCDRDSPRREWLARRVALLDSLATSHGFRWMMLYLPLSYQTAEGPGLCARDAVAAMASELDVVFADPLRLHPPGERLFYDPTHLTPAGHRWVAETLAAGMDSVTIGSEEGGLHAEL